MNVVLIVNRPASRISGETYFFRDHGQFDMLRLHLLPELIKRRSGARILRLWSAGCSSGEEAYSLAILIDIVLPERADWNISIIGSDIDPVALTKARQGRYGSWSFRTAPAGLQQRYFLRKDDEWLLDERIRRMVSFCNVDLIGGHFPNGELRDMDLILCRNVFIYFDAETVAAVANKLVAAISVGGYLMTAHTELIGHRLQDMQSRLFVDGVVYQRLAKAPAEIPSPVSNELFSAGIKKPFSVSTVTPAAASDADWFASARELADRGEYIRAEQVCRKALAAEPLAAEAHFLLAQLAQLRGDFDQACELLNKTLYLAPDCVAAALELAALYERVGSLPKAQALRHRVLNIVRALPGDRIIEFYEITAAEMAQWLAQ